MIIETVALLATATLFGGMLLYSFGFAPLVFTKLPVARASKLLRDAFPFYYLFVIGVATAALPAGIAVALYRVARTTAG